MRVTTVNFQFPIRASAKPVMWNHPAHRTLDQQFGMACTPAPDVFGLVAPDEAGKAHITFLLFFFSRKLNLLGVDHDDKIAGIDVGSENGFFFSAQKFGGLDRDAAEHLVLGVDQPPLALNFVGFGGKGLHRGEKEHGNYEARP